MRVELTDEQAFLREAVAGVLAREAPAPQVRAWAEAGDTAAADEIAIRQGWIGIGLDEELGGQGGGAIELMVVAEELGRGAVPWDRLLGACLASQLLAASDSELAPALAAAQAEGEHVAAFCVDGRRPPAAPPVHSMSDRTLDLTAQYVPGVKAASLLLVAIRAGDGVRLVAVASDGPGVTITPQPLVDHTRSLSMVEMRGAVYSELGAVSAAALERTQSLAAVLVAADALGAASRMLEMTTAYVTDRRQFGVPVGSFQAVKHAAAEMLVDVEASRSAVRYAAWTVAAGSADAAIWAAIAKSFASAAAVRVADRALFLHGAIGYTWEHDLQFLFKRARSDEQLFGSPEMHRDLISDFLALEPAQNRVSRQTSSSPSGRQRSQAR